MTTFLLSSVSLETVRPNVARQRFQFVPKGDFLESSEDIPEPHEFDALLTLDHGGHGHTCRVEFREDGHHHHVEGGSKEFQDAHEREHAQDILQRFGGRPVTTPQIVLFGITGGLMPCPAAFTVLLVCLQLKRVALGFVMAGAFSFGLALTMVATGALAAWSVQHAQRRFHLLASYMAWQGWHGLYR